LKIKFRKVTMQMLLAAVLSPSKRHFGRFIAYYRVSTDRQGKSVLLDAQKKAVDDYLNGGP
jgi:hypothetical protein